MTTGESNTGTLRRTDVTAAPHTTTSTILSRSEPSESSRDTSAAPEPPRAAIRQDRVRIARVNHSINVTSGLLRHLINITIYHVPLNY